MSFTRRLPALLLALLAPIAGAQIHPLGADLEVTDIGHAPAVAVAADGGFAVAWADPGPDPLRGIVRARRFAADGTGVGAPIEVGEYVAGIAGHAAPPVDLVLAADGALLVAWSGPASEDPVRPTPYLRRFAADGTPSPWTLRIAGANPMPAFGPRLALRPDGLMVAAWMGVHPDGRSTDVFAIRLNASGQHYLPAVRVHAGEDGAQRLGDVAVAPNGWFAVAWRSAAAGGGERLRVRVFRSDAEPLAGEVDLGPVVPAEAPFGALDDRPGPALAGLADGNWIVAWEGENGDGGTVLARRLGANGLPLAATFTVPDNVHENGPGGQRSPALAATPEGFVALWVDDGRDGSGRGVFGRTFDLAALPRTDGYQVPYDGRQEQYAPVLAASAGGAVAVWLHADAWVEVPSPRARRLGDPPPASPNRPVGPVRPLGSPAGAVDLAAHGDGFVAVWSEIRPAGAVVLGQRLQADADPGNTVFAVGPYLADERSGPPQVASAAAAGTFVVAWTARRPETGSPGVYARRFDAGNFALGEPFLVSGEGPRARYAPRVATTPEGAFLVAWTAEVGGGDTDVFARRFHADGTPAGSSFRVNTFAGEAQQLTGLAMAANGLAVAVWRGWNGPEAHWDVLATRIHPGNAVDPEQIVQVAGGPVGANEGDGTVARLADGTWLVAFHDGSDVVARRYVSQGPSFDPVTGEIVLHRGRTGFQARPDLAALPAGGFVVVWTSDCDPRTPSAACTGAASPDGSGSAVLGRFFDADLWPVRELSLADDPTGFQDGGAVAVNGSATLAAWVTGDRGTGEGPQPPVAEVRALAPFACPGDVGGDTVCLGGGRFLLEVEWEDFQGGAGRGSGTARGDDWATFWFFHPANVELAVKVLDGRPVNGHWWVFYASLTNVPFRLWVHDLDTGASRLYENPPRTFASRGDTLAFPEAVAGGSASASTTATGTAPSWATAWAASGEATGPAAGRATGLLAIPATAGDALLCEPSATRLCLQGAAFPVEIDWRDFAGNTGTGRAEALSTDSGYFWFFRPGNPEVLVKVLDGRPVNGHWWVFYASLTNVAFELRVTHPQSGGTVVYENPLRHFASRGDTTAFP